jgi:hypothetical protein
MITQCCECRKVCADERWVEPVVPLPADERVSYGFCPRCADQAMQVVDAFYSNVNQTSNLGAG